MPIRADSPDVDATFFLSMLGRVIGAIWSGEPVEFGVDLSGLDSFITTGDKICARAAGAVGDLADDVKIRHGDEGGNPPKMNWVPVPS